MKFQLLITIFNKFRNSKIVLILKAIVIRGAKTSRTIVNQCEIHEIYFLLTYKTSVERLKTI